MNMQIIILGAGGHARVLLEILRRRGATVLEFVDSDVRLHGQDIDSVRVIGGDEAVFSRNRDEVMLVNGIGNHAKIGSGGLGLRRRLYQTFSENGYYFMEVISKDAMVAMRATLKTACQVLTGAIIHPHAVIGENTIINTGARIDHDCHIGAHSHIAPGAILCGNVTVGSECHIGAGAVIIQGITIGDGAVVGAGAVVVDDVAPGATVLGCPARPM